MSELAKKSCVPCKEGALPLAGEELKRHFDLLEEGWELIEGKKIKKTYKFKDFKGALHFVDEVGKVAEEEGHHPDIELSYGKATITLWTHKISGLSESDFVMAAKSDVVFTSHVK